MDRIVRIVFRQYGFHSQPDIDDAVQDVYLTTMERCRTKQLANAAHYFAKTVWKEALKRCCTALKQRKKENPTDPDFLRQIHTATATPSVLDAVILAETLGKFEQCRAKLPTEELLALDADNRTVRDVAAAIRRTPQTVRNRKKAALQKLSTATGIVLTVRKCGTVRKSARR